PSFTQSGSYTIRFTSNDGKTSSQAQDVTINVANVNQAPTLNTITTPQAANEGQALNFTVSGSDPDGTTPTYTATYLIGGVAQANLPTGASFNTTTGAFNWTPSFTQSGSYVIRFRSTDGSLTSQAQDVTINVANVNQAPTLNTITTPQAVNEGQALNFTVSGSDPDGTTVSYTAEYLIGGVAQANLPTGASFNTTTGAFNWTPSFTQSGSYTIRFRSTDGSLTSQAQDVTINVANVNQAPTLNTITTPQAVNEGQALNFTVSGSDPDGTTPTYTATYLIGGVAQANLPTGASFNTTTGAFNWTPSFTQSGSYVIRFRSTDGSLTSQAQDVTINVTDVAVVAPQWRLYSVGQNMKSESYAGGVVKAGMGASYANLVINHFLNLADCQANANVWDPRSSVILDATGAWSTNINKPAGTTLWARFVDSNNVAVSACSSATLP
ncbi:putative Ig domain-containing protein, partial [Deinococcus yavapaiensis]